MMEMIKDLKENTMITSQFLVINVAKGVTAAGKPYINVTLQDATGTIEGKKWEVVEEDNDIFVIGNLVEVRADVIFYKTALQLKIHEGKKIDASTIKDYSHFVPAAPVEKEILVKELKEFLDSMEEGDVKRIVTYLIEKHYEEYISWPAAVRNHHNYVSGLLYHSLSMAKLADQVCKLYPELNRDMVIGSCLIHDIGKITELSGPIATKFSLNGKMLGHISIGQAEVKEACSVLKIEGEIAVLMEHMILSHHTKPEFGSPVMPLTREALVLAMVDDLDAKMNILDKAYVGVKKGEYTGKLFTMDDRYFYKPLYTKEED